MTRESNGTFDLLKHVILIYVFIGIINRVVVRITIMWITFNILVFLDLYRSSNSILTEWYLIPSGATGDDLRYKIY